MKEREKKMKVREEYFFFSLFSFWENDSGGRKKLQEGEDDFATCSAASLSPKGGWETWHREDA